MRTLMTCALACTLALAFTVDVHAQPQRRPSPPRLKPIQVKKIQQINPKLKLKPKLTVFRPDLFVMAMKKVSNHKFAICFANKGLVKSKGCRVTAFVMKGYKVVGTQTRYLKPLNRKNQPGDRTWVYFTSREALRGVLIAGWADSTNVVSEMSEHNNTRAQYYP